MCVASIAALSVVIISVFLPACYGHWLPLSGIESGILEPIKEQKFRADLYDQYFSTRILVSIPLFRTELVEINDFK